MPVPAAFWLVARAKQRHIPILEQRYQHHACQKSANMRKIGNTASIIGQRGGHRYKLPGNLHTKHNPGWQIDKADKDQNHQQCANRSLGMQDKIRPQNTGNAA